MKKLLFIPLFALILAAGSCEDTSQERADQAAVQRQQSQYSIGQPVPAYDWSLERHLVISLYNIRNTEVATHSVWRSIDGTILYDCPSMGYGLPYDTSLTNPLQVAGRTNLNSASITSIGQAEPNGVFASTNTSATWVMCIGDGGLVEPVYVEAVVNVYPFPLDVDYTNNLISKAGEATVTVSPNR